MDAETIKLWLQATNMMGTFALGVWLYLEKRGDKTNDRVSALACKVEQLDKDMSSLEATLESSPTHQDLGALHERINAVAKGVDMLAGEFAGVKNVVNLIHEHLLRGKIQ